MNRQDTLYECLECREKEVVAAGDPRKDGRCCVVCGGYSSPAGFIGVDLATAPDTAIQVHPMKGVVDKQTILKEFGIPKEQWDDLKRQLKVDEQWEEFLRMNGGTTTWPV